MSTYKQSRTIVLVIIPQKTPSIDPYVKSVSVSMRVTSRADMSKCQVLGACRCKHTASRQVSSHLPAECRTN